MIVLYAMQEPLGCKLEFTVEAVKAVKGAKQYSRIKHERIIIHVLGQSKISVYYVTRF